jgi:twitching motility protein PilT
MPAIDKLQLNELINQAIKDDAISIYFNIGNYPVMKINSGLKDLRDRPILTKEFLNTISNTILPDEQKIILQEKKELTIGYDWSDNVRLSVNFFYQKNSLSVTIKLIPALVKKIEELGLPRIVNNVIDFNSGLVVICGPVSSGRTTTASAIIQSINEKHEKRIVTIEDPIERQFINKKSIIQQREIGRDVDSFVNGLTDVIDEDVNLVYLSRIATAEEIKINIGTAIPREDELFMEVTGRNIISGMPKTVTLSSNETVEALTNQSFNESIISFKESISIVVCVWFAGFNSDEKEFLRGKLNRLLRKQV